MSNEVLISQIVNQSLAVGVDVTRIMPHLLSSEVLELLSVWLDAFEEGNPESVTLPDGITFLHNTDQILVRGPIYSLTICCWAKKSDCSKPPGSTCQDYTICKSIEKQQENLYRTNWTGPSVPDIPLTARLLESWSNRLRESWSNRLRESWSNRLRREHGEQIIKLLNLAAEDPKLNETPPVSLGTVTNVHTFDYPFVNTHGSDQEETRTTNPETDDEK